MQKASEADFDQLPSYEEVEHTADWALRIRGRDLRELLVNAARGMSNLLVSDPTQIPPSVEEHFYMEASDAEGLLVNWLSELAYRAEVEGVVFGEFHLHQVSPTHLQAVVRGGPVSKLQKHVKAVTYHNLEIIETEDGLLAEVVFDV